MTSKDELTWMNVFVRVGLNAATHPIEYAKVLIQIGHEPLPPYKSRTIFGRERMYYPNIFSYIAHIKRKDGFFGCYRGLGPKLSGNITSGLVAQKVMENITFPELDGDDVEVDNLTMKERAQRSFQRTLRDSAGRAAAAIVSQPFHVISVRYMAEFVGEDGKYTNIFSSIAVIYREEGLKGFFSGLVPRVLCDMGTLWLANLTIFLINNYLVEDKDLKSYIRAAMRFMASAIMYPLQVVGNCMAASGSGLVACSPPHMPLFTSWIDCYRHLRSINGLKRGSSLLWRPYRGHQIIGQSGVVFPSPEMFRDPKSKLY